MNICSCVSSLAVLGYPLRVARWKALTRYREDGRVEIDNNAAERELRAVALARKNYLFAGADCGGERAASIYAQSALDGMPVQTGTECVASGETAKRCQYGHLRTVTRIDLLWILQRHACRSNFPPA